MVRFVRFRRCGLALVVAAVLLSTAGPVGAPATGITVLNAPVAPGASLSFEVTDDADGPADTIQVWIDDDGNGEFTNGERRTTVTPSTAGGTVSGTITVPNGLNGTYQLMAREKPTNLQKGDLPDVQTSFEVDPDPPTVASITTRDRDEDGKVDAADVVFSEPIDDSTVRAADWEIAGIPAESVSTTVGGDGDVDDDRVQVRIDTDANEVPGTDGKDVTYKRGTTADGAGNLLGSVASGDVTETDGAGPALTTAATADTNDDGDIDEIALTMSEDVDDGASTLDTTAFTVSTGSVTGVSSGTADDDALTLTVSGITGTNATPTVTQTASKITDTAGNTIGTDRTVTTTDGAAPRVESITVRDRDEDGDVDAADVTFTEPIVDASVVANDWTIGGQTVSSVSTTVGSDGDVDDDKIQLQLGTGTDGTAATDVIYTADAPKDADVTDAAGIEGV